MGIFAGASTMSIISAGAGLLGAGVSVIGGIEQGQAQAQAAQAAAAAQEQQAVAQNEAMQAAAQQSTYQAQVATLPSLSRTRQWQSVPLRRRQRRSRCRRLRVWVR